MGYGLFMFRADPIVFPFLNCFFATTGTFLFSSFPVHFQFLHFSSFHCIQFFQSHCILPFPLYFFSHVLGFCFSSFHCILPFPFHFFCHVLGSIFPVSILRFRFQFQRRFVVLVPYGFCFVAVDHNIRSSAAGVIFKNHQGRRHEILIPAHPPCGCCLWVCQADAAA